MTRKSCIFAANHFYRGRHMCSAVAEMSESDCSEQSFDSAMATVRDPELDGLRLGVGSCHPGLVKNDPQRPLLFSSCHPPTR